MTSCYEAATKASPWLQPRAPASSSVVGKAQGRRSLRTMDSDARTPSWKQNYRQDTGGTAQPHRPSAWSKPLHGTSALKTLLCAEDWAVGVGACARTWTPRDHTCRAGRPQGCQGARASGEGLLDGLPALRVEARAWPANWTGLPRWGGQN